MEALRRVGSTMLRPAPTRRQQHSRPDPAGRERSGTRRRLRRRPIRNGQRNGNGCGQRSHATSRRHSGSTAEQRPSDHADAIPASALNSQARAHQRVVRDEQGARGRDPPHAGPPGHRAHRAVRLRQVDVPPDPQPHARARPDRRARGIGACSTATTSTRRRQRPTETRRDIGMVFQKPNPFPAMSIYDNVLAGPKLTRTPVARSGRARRGEPSARRAVERGAQPPRGPRRRALRRTAATALHRTRARDPPAGAAHGRAVLGARPDVDAPDRGDDRRDRP